MKMMIASLIALSSLSAFAGQTINCRQINKDGSLTKKGVELNLTMTSARAGHAQVKRISKDPSDIINTLVVRSVNVGATIADESPFTTIFMLPKEDDGMLDIQLQFDAHVMKKNFSNVKATFVIGSDAAEPEVAFAYGYDMTCNGRKN